MNSAVYVSDGKKKTKNKKQRSRTPHTADIIPFYSFNQSSDTKNICKYGLLVCKFYALDFSRRFDMAVPCEIYLRRVPVERLQSGYKVL